MDQVEFLQDACWKVFWALSIRQSIRKIDLIFRFLDGDIHSYLKLRSSNIGMKHNKNA